MSWNNSDILSQPLSLHWMGWESTTFKLQNNGWELSASQDVEQNRMAIAFRHKQMQCRGMSDYMDFDYFSRLGNNLYSVSSTDQTYPMFGCRLASDLIIQIQDVNINNTCDFNPIDARPMYRTQNMRSHSLDDIAHFRKLEKTDNEIYLEPASMDDILNMALERQAPRQEEIRKKMIHRQELEVMRSSQLKAHLRLVV